MKRNFRILIEYDGTEFHGWQVQPGQRTVQEELEKAIETVTKQTIRVYGAGRTDAGVHALGQVANFFLEEDETGAPPVTAGKLLAGLNALTGDDITVRSVEEAAETFSSRKGVAAKTYRYRIDNAKFPSPLLRRTHLHVSAPLSIDAMNEAGRLLEGTHDFTAFRAADFDDSNPVVRDMKQCIVEKRGSEATISVVSRGFLKNMVRIIAGTLLLVGRGKMQPAEIPAILESRDRTKAGPTAPAHGLVLVNIEYA
ncbi:MAG: tRNA pseudouridine(38-40) synthase TruA [Pseudomonadota bacterium]